MKITSLLSSPFLRHTLTLLILLATIFTWYLFVYYPLQDKLLKLQAQIQGLRAAHESMEDAQEASQRTASELAQAQETIAPYIQNEFCQEWLHEVIMQCIQTIKGSGLMLVACVLDKEQSKSYWKYYPLRISMSGSLQSLQTFFKNMHQHQPLISYKKLMMTHGNDEKYSVEMVLYIPSLRPLT